MNVLAFSTPGHPDWHWRIVDDDGKTVEESFTAFPTIDEAVAEGASVFSVASSAMSSSCGYAGCSR